MAPDVILTNGRFTTLDPAEPNPEAVAIEGGRFSAVGAARDILPSAGPATQIIDLGGRRAIPGLIDSHLHVIRGGLNYNMELRWDGVPTLADAMAHAEGAGARHAAAAVGARGRRVHRAPVRREAPADARRDQRGRRRRRRSSSCTSTIARCSTPPRCAPWATPRTRPIRPAARSCATPQGNPTGLLLAKPNAAILYAHAGEGPEAAAGVPAQLDAPFHARAEPARRHRRDRCRRRLPELSRRLRRSSRSCTPTGSSRCASPTTSSPRSPAARLRDFTRWAGMVKPGQGDDIYRANGAGEMLVFSAADFEDFREPRPDMPPQMEGELEAVVRILAEQPLAVAAARHLRRDDRAVRSMSSRRSTATFRSTGCTGSSTTPRPISRSQHRPDRRAGRRHRRPASHGLPGRVLRRALRRQGGRSARRRSRRMLAAGVPVGAGTDATRVASYNPWVSLWWLVTGKTVGGTRLYPRANRLDREQALRLWTEANSLVLDRAGQEGPHRRRPARRPRGAVGRLHDRAGGRDPAHLVGADRAGRQGRPWRRRLRGAGAAAAAGDARLVAGAPFRRLPGPRRTDRRAELRLLPMRCVRFTAMSTRFPGLAAAPVADRRGFWGALGCSCWAF